MPNILTIGQITELAPLAEKVKISALKATIDLTALLKTTGGMNFFRKLRFEKVGKDPLDSKRPLNFVEQLNQTWSYLVAFAATRYLLEHHKKSAPFILKLGPISGPDIVSHDCKITAEVFAAVTPSSNDKLKKDVQKVSKETAKHKYVFYFCPRSTKKEKVVQVNGVTVTTVPLKNI